MEGFGIVLLEAGACGLPMVTTDIVGLAEETEKGSAGEVIRPREAGELAEFITRSLHDKKSR